MTPMLIPYWPGRVIELGPIPVDPWATLVALGFVVGLEVCRARGLKRGMSPRDVVDGAVFIVAMGFVVGHLVHVLAYNPHLMSEDPWILLKVWAGFSSFGGFLGAVIGSVIFYSGIRKLPYWKYTDNIMFGLPFGWFFGRMGCFVVHDHIGRRSDSFLAVDFPGGPRLDLGLCEALWIAVIALAFTLASRRERAPGFYLALWAVLYAPVRFSLDFLRNDDLSFADVRWSGLTPAQYGAIVMFLAGLAVIGKLRRETSDLGSR